MSAIEAELQKIRRRLEAEAEYGVGLPVEELEARQAELEERLDEEKAAELKALVKAGWNVLDTGAYDLFPQTVHVEVMALLTPPDAPTLDGRAPQRRMVRGG